MKRLIQIVFLIVLFWAGNNIIAQNLVPNGDFETHTGCGPAPEDAPPWYDPTGRSSDYLNSCDTGGFYSVPLNIYGYQPARSGQAYCLIGVCIYWYHCREYISIPLINPLVAEKKYCAKFYISLGDKSQIAIDALGAFFSVGRIDTAGRRGYLVDSNYNPQVSNRTNLIIRDTMNWSIINGSFTAQGGENYMTIGCFIPDEQVRYERIRSIIEPNDTIKWCAYYIDDVSVYECDNPDYPAGAGNDRTMCRGDSVQLGTTNYGYYQYSWSPKTGLSDTASGTPWVKPLITTTYYLTQTNFFDTITTSFVTITVKNCDTTAQDNILLIYPNPSQGEFYIEFSEYVPEGARFTVSNTLGQILIKNNITREEKKKLVNTGFLASGVYFCRVYAGENLMRSEKIVKVISDK